MPSKIEALTAYALLIGFTSNIFMVWVFINEAFYGRGVLFFEPSRPMAMFEFFLAVSGMIMLGMLMLASFASVTRPKHDKTEPTGYPKSDRAYG